ncbi:protein FATTY ACID EXPORT 2, chloroplastic-like isoform X1 [Macadamia integrifolia]|uniref:protein FATTY ACID EXPORT 2, chloroplastic-like isoform X1 n=1 Tax=Macadamia integrifolia TaxID=60698 RepID=UPI001C4FB88C|nr:protein FATTY ACID EXPORT 2, chloroplastic-like isoform X1 [Macadamia integrifolia]
MAESLLVFSKSIHLHTHAATLVSAPHRSSCDHISFGCLKHYRSSSSILLHRKTCPKQQRRPSEAIRVIAGSDVTSLIPEKAKEEFEFPLDSSGGDGFGGSGGGGGGGGGDGGGGDDENRNGREGNNDDGVGDSNGNDNNTMAMLMSQKLTLVYAALVGGFQAKLSYKEKNECHSARGFHYRKVWEGQMYAALQTPLRVGGVIGYLKRGSQKSLAAGGLAVLLLYYVYTELPVRPAFASSLGLGLSAVLLGVMGSRFKKSGKIFPAGVVSLVSLIMAGGYLHGFLRSVHV